VTRWCNYCGRPCGECSCYEDEDRFGVCYECRDGYHERCVGSCCDCSCEPQTYPDPAAEQDARENRAEAQ
jgi:hypothetical protein